MAYRIEYYRKHEKVGVVPCPMSLDDAMKAARVGLVRLDADSASIRDEKGNEVGMVKRDA
jgi:hypothetical protein